MKTIANNLLIVTALSLLFLSCSTKDDLINLVVPSQTEEILTRSSIKPSEAKARLISKEMIPTILKGYLDKKTFDKVDDYSLNTVSKDGKDLIYIVNLTDGGWVLVSGIMIENENPILGYSTEGQYDPEDIQSPEAAFWLEMTESMIESRIDEFEEQRSGLRSFGNDYFWVLIPINPQITTVTNSSVLPLLSTKWGQESPWNYKCPTIDSTYVPMNGSIQCPTGCAATAYAQVLYYLHNHLGKPTKLYHQIDTVYEWHTGYFMPQHQFNGLVNNSTRWSSMPLENPGYRTTGTDYVGDLMIELGERLHMSYFIESYSIMGTSLFSTWYDLSCSSLVDFNSSIVVSQLDNSLPVIVGAFPTQTSTMGHTWVIDGHQTTTTTVDQQYQWRKFPIADINLYNDYICYSEFEMQMLHPGVVEYQIIHDYSYFSSSTFWMNFGWDGDNDGLYSMPYYEYPYRTQMIYNFQIQ
jgi:hypothetical protein